LRSLSIFYILVLYVFLQFCWWTFLLARQNQEIYGYKTSMAAEKEEKERLRQELRNKWLMIGGEGAVFLLLLALGIVKTRSAFKKEIDLNRQQRNFLLSVTHEFKSPLAAIRLYLQTLQKHDLEKEKRDAFFRHALDDTERLNKLVENALFASQMESSSFTFNKKPVSLSELIARIVSGHPSKERIRTELRQDAYINADPLALTSLVTNLIENALKYSDKGSEVVISLDAAKGRAVLRIADQGIGIHDKEKSKIFEKFYRVGNEETRNTKGTGLGLFIARHIAEGHEGKICVKNNSPKGSIFEVSFPKLSYDA
jgi:two-component system, OmpR family, phosphate regulon sensor histidine kinase PhoR